MIPGLVGRRVALEIGVAGAPGVRFEALRIGFRAKHTASSTPNEATVQLYNPAPTTVALAQVPGASIRILAGYEITGARQIFAGDVIKNGVRVTRTGPDRILEVQAADGAAGLQRLVSVSITAPTTFEVVLGQILAQTLWARGLINIPTSTTLPQGVTHVGTASALLDRLTRALGAVWYVRDGALCILSRGAPLPEAAPLFSSAAGTLIGTPSPTDKGLQVTALLDAGMRPGRRFVVASQSPGYSGTYTAGDVTFVGDSGYDAPFYVQVVGRAA